MSHLTCEIAVRRASDHLSGLLTDAEADELDGHLTGCEHCSCLLEQLREAVAVLGSRPGLEVPDTVHALVDATGDRGDALSGQLPRPHADADADADADEAGSCYPDFYTDGPDAGAWVDPPVAWGHVRDSGDDASITELGSAVDATLARLDPLDRGLLTLVDIEGAPVSRAALELELSTTQARKRLGNARFAVRAALDRHFTG